MAKEKVMLEKKQFGDMTVVYDSFSGVVVFSLEYEEIFRKTIEECEKIYPQYLWRKVKEAQYTTFYL